MPRSHITFIDDPSTLDIKSGKPKALAFSIERQHGLLNRVSELLDSASQIPSVTKHLGPMSPTNLKKAHQELESGRSIG